MCLSKAGIGQTTRLWAAKRWRQRAAESSPCPSFRAILRRNFCRRRARAMRRADHPARQGARQTPEILTMILPTVRERLEGVLRRPALEQALDALRGGAPDVSVSGLHDVAKALVAAHFFQELRRPAFLIVENTARAEALTEGVRFFVTALGGNAARVEVLPAFDVFPWEEKPPDRKSTRLNSSHANISYAVF